MIIFLSFISLIAFTLMNHASRAQLKAKAWDDWLLDGLGLSIQGIVIPLLQTTVIYQIYRHLFPHFQGSLHLSPLTGFLLSFVAIDYVYYWNHRWLHGRYIWNIHQVHHTITEMDVLSTSRNTLWASLFIVYVWIHALFVYVLSDSTGYLLGVSLTAALDLWRHSQFGLDQKSKLYFLLSPWLILPNDHAWHHASAALNSNYGANLKLWDRLHRTYHLSDRQPVSLGIQTSLSLPQKLVFPFS